MKMKFKLINSSVPAGKNILISFCIFLLSFIAFFSYGYFYVINLVPPDGYVYPSAPSLEGVYDCCGNVPNTAYSKVSGVVINCAKPGLGMGGGSRFGDSHTACGLMFLNGREVLVQQKMVLVSGSTFFPTSLHQAAYVVNITDRSTQKVFFDRDDAALRDQWVAESIFGIFITSLVCGIFLSGIVFLKISKLSKGD